MAFNSYAQNFEDIILWRALKHIENGFYIDIGAQDPIVDSVSFGFYEQGWRGIHFEPTNFYSTKLSEARPDENVYQVAISNSFEPITIYEFASTGLSTGQQEIAENYIESGRDYEKTVVPSITLDQALEYSKGKDIHWLKIDVEGMESIVLSSWINSLIRPWILVIESTKPGTQVECFDEWEPIVIQKGYEFVYFDGLNRYYLSEEHSELREKFRNPVNIFDDFVLAGLSSRSFFSSSYQEINEKFLASEVWGRELQGKVFQLELEKKELNEKFLASEIEKEELRRTVSNLDKSLQDTKQEIISIFSSTSWRITAPLRWVSNQFKFIAVHGIRARMKILAHKLLRHSVLYINSRPIFKRKIIKITEVIGVKYKLIRLYRKYNYSFSEPELNNPLELSGVGEQTQKIYTNLMHIIESNKKVN